MSAYSVGIDLHPYRSSVEILDCNGHVFKRCQVKGPLPELTAWLAAEVPGEMAVCFEASCGYGYAYEQLSRVAQRVKVAHPGHLRLIYRSKRKNDRVDASKLAKLMYLDAVPAVHVPSSQVRLWRQTIEFRQKLLTGQVATKNQLRALLRERGIRPPRGLWTRKGLAWLAGVELDEQGSALQRDLLLEQLRQTRDKILRVEKQLKAISDGHPAGVMLLRTIPGIGPRTAEALAAYIDDVRRFDRLKQVGAYFGWAPCQDASGAANRLGHITRDGPSTVRKLMCEAAWTAVRTNTTVRRYFQRVMRDDPDRKKIAIVATAHRMIRVMGAMMRAGTAYDPAYDPAAFRGQ